MNSCPECRSNNLLETELTEQLLLGGYRITGKVPAHRCEACGATFYVGGGLKQFELRAAGELAERGARGPEVFRFLRKAMNLRASDLASLLDVSSETISRWENNERALDSNALAVLQMLAVEAVAGRSTLRERLSSRGAQDPVSRQIDLGRVATGG